MTEGFSGADLQALLSDAQLAAVHDVLSCADSNKPAKTPVITDSLLKSIASKARCSVSEAEKRRLYTIYSQFLDSKKSAASQVSLPPRLHAHIGKTKIQFVLQVCRVVKICTPNI